MTPIRRASTDRHQPQEYSHNDITTGEDRPLFHPLTWRKRAPAYSRPLAAAIAAGHEPAHGICVWLDRKPEDGGTFAGIACFADIDPAALDWSLCAGRDVVIPRADEADPGRLEALIEAIKVAQPRRLQVYRTLDDGRVDVEFVVTGGAS